MLLRTATGKLAGGELLFGPPPRLTLARRCESAVLEKGDDLTPKQKKELTEEEKENKSKRKDIQEKLIKFATRIPVFMYLTDYREYCLKDVIQQLEPELFRKVTGLTLKDFSLLVSLGVFNGEVISLEDNFIILRLSDREVRFRYPDAFVRGYLECLDK